MSKKGIFKRTAAFILCAATFAALSGAAAQSARVENVREGEAVFSQWMRIEAGEGENQVGYRQDRISSGGPEDFLFTPEGELCIMDAVNHRIMFFEGGAWVRNLSVEFVNHPDLFCYYDGSFYILDAYSDRLFEVNAQTGEYAAIATPEELPSICVFDVFADESGAYVHFNDNSVYAVEGSKLVKSPMIYSTSVSGGTARVDVGERSWRIDAPNCSASLVHADDKGNIYLMMSEGTDDCSTLLVETTLRKYDKDGRLVGRAILPFEDWFCMPSRTFRVDGDGRIQMMICENGFVGMYTLTLGTSMETNMPELTRRAREMDEESRNTQTKGAQYSISLTRDQVRKRAADMVNLTWTLQAGNKEPPSGTKLPDYIKNASPGTRMTGIPYCWGGFNGLTAVGSKKRFLDIIREPYQGHLYSAGNILGSGNYKSGTAGLDCSGFVSYAYGLSKKWGTGGLLSDLGHNISHSQLQPMDMLVKEGHVMLFIGKSGAKYDVYEATTDDIDKTVRRLIEKKDYDKYKAKTPWHRYVSSYTHDAVNHWRKCIDGCTSITSKGVHKWSSPSASGRYFCTVCNRLSLVPPPVISRIARLNTPV